MPYLSTGWEDPPNSQQAFYHMMAPFPLLLFMHFFFPTSPAHTVPYGPLIKILMMFMGNWNSVRMHYTTQTNECLCAAGPGRTSRLWLLWIKICHGC